MNWSIGVTTAARPIPTLDRMLKSLWDAGFHEHQLFDDNERGLGCWSNWWLALNELYLRNPLADAYMMAQDDIVFAKDVRPYLEQAWHHLDLKCGCLNLWVRGGRETGAYGICRAKKVRFASGACCLIFPRFALRKLLTDPMAFSHRKGPKGAANIDGLVKRWMRKRRLREWTHQPSLVQHIGCRNSTLGEKHGRRSNLQSKTFVGEDFSAMSLLKRVA